MNIEIQNFISIFVFRYSPPWRFCAQICTIANVLIANIMFAVEVLTFTHLRKKNLKNLNIEIQNFISIFVFRYSPPWRFCAQICTIANVLIANIMFAVEVLTFTHLRKKNLEKFEYRNTEFHFDFRFSIFAPLAFLCSNLYYSERAHCEYHVRSEGSHFHEIQNFISIFVFRYSPPWRFCAQICTIANVLIANIMFAVEVLTFTYLRKKNLEKFEYRKTEFYFDFCFSKFAPFAFLC